MVQLGQYPAPSHTILHLSDPHLLADGHPLYGALAQETTLVRALEQIEESEQRPDAIVVTGDLTDLAEPDAYRRLRAHLEPLAERLDTELVWVLGNHDEREPFREHLLGVPPTGAPYDRVVDLRGLRLVVLDSTVPGYHHGELEPTQLDWLRDVLAEPAERGTLLALHHPPMPSPVELMAVLELQRQHELAEVIRGTDVRGILAGHLHHSSHATFAGVPVSVAGATCYSVDPAAPRGSLRGLDGGRSYDLVQVYDDTIAHSTIPIGSPPVVSGFPASVLEAIAELPPAERLEAFSSKTSTFDIDGAIARRG